ncbi:MAG: S8 family serine peptidase, partial [Halioglobus sp.]|nr:S8 family serine peptidase [Halioglobus sp.]
GMLYHVSGTSFAAPMVSGAASLLLALDPGLSAQALRRMLLHSARDLDTPGRDIATGYGLLDVGAALDADPAFYVEAAINTVQVTKRDGRTLVQVLGTADADAYAGAALRLGAGEAPDRWQDAGEGPGSAVVDGLLAEIDAARFAGAARWVIELEVAHANGASRVARFDLKLR